MYWNMLKSVHVKNSMKIVKSNLVQDAASQGQYNIFWTFTQHIFTCHVYRHHQYFPCNPYLTTIEKPCWNKYHAYPPRPWLDRYFGWKLGIKHRIGHLAHPEEPPTNFTTPVNCSQAQNSVLPTHKGHDLQKSGQTCAHKPFSRLFPPSRFGSCICPYCSNEARCSCACHFFLDVRDEMQALSNFTFKRVCNSLQYQPHKVVFHICHISIHIAWTEPAGSFSNIWP